MRHALDVTQANAAFTGAGIDVIAVGKAAAGMIDGFRSAAPRPIRHVLAIAPAPPVAVQSGVEWHVTAHPAPDERSVAAAERALGLARACGPDHVLAVLVSGGASSLMAAPAAGLGLADKRSALERLARSGTAIDALNCVRKHLSAVKGGRLAACARGPVVTLLLSDVVGDDPAVIGSGPTVPDPTTYGDALAVLEAHGSREAYPAAVVAHLERGARGEVDETIKPPGSSRWITVLVGGAATALGGARAAAEALGYVVTTLSAPLVGEARRTAAEVLATWRRESDQWRRPVCVLGAGETTVRVTGAGRGGRNQEFALALVDDLARLGHPAAVLCAGTDGIDGPTDAAGAIVDTHSAARGAAAGLRASAYLRANDSYTYFETLGDLVRWGPTGTNVGDLVILLAG